MTEGPLDWDHYSGVEMAQDFATEFLASANIRMELINRGIVQDTNFA